MRDDEVDGGTMTSTHTGKVPTEPDAEALGVTEEWPQLAPLELAVCLADSDLRPFGQRPRPRPR
jgi:hypothetical protein